MWIARDKDNWLNLFHNKPYRSTVSWKSKYENDIPFLLMETLFPLLKWEDEPVEVGINLCKSLMICPKCGKRIWYNSKDIHESHSEEPWSGYYEEWECIVCPECKENIII